MRTQMQDEAGVAKHHAKQVDNQTDEQLLLEFRRTGDEVLFDQIVARYRNELLGYLLRQLRYPELAEDALQQVFIKLFRKCDQFEEGRRFRPWIFQIARNQSIDSRRREQRHAHVRLDEPEVFRDGEQTLGDILESDVSPPAAIAERRELYDLSCHAVDSLPARLSRAVNLVYRDQMKYGEAAEALSVPLGTVKSRLHGALTSLRSMLNPPQAVGAAQLPPTRNSPARQFATGVGTGL